MNQAVTEALHKLADQQGLCVLFACESGSRAWGFASPDSDYDARFIFCRPLESYLLLNPPKDTVDVMLPGDLDFVGWDLQKALRLFAKSNCALYEWLGSPEVYWEEPHFADDLRDLIRHYFNPKGALYHYLGGAKTTIERYGLGTLAIKKVFYMLRPLLAGCWIVKYQTMPPTQFDELLAADLLDEQMMKAVTDLLKQKETAIEGEQIVLNPVIAQWIESQMASLKTKAEKLPTAKVNDLEPLNRIFLKWLRY